MNTLLHFRSIALAALMLLAGVFSMNAQTTTPASDIPRTISYQGLLTSTDGNAYPDGQYQVTVTLYGDAQGAGAIWQDTYTTHVTGGVFNLYLGDGSRPLPGPGMMNTPLWIGTSVNGAGEMRPLTPLAASPYAFNVSDKAITGNKIADGTITAEKLDLDYISELQIDGEKVSAKGTVLNLVSTPAVPLSYDAATQSVTVGRVPAQAGDKEKEAAVQGTTNDYWTAQGDIADYASGATAAAGIGDWIGTSAVDFIVKTGGAQVTNFQISTLPGFANIVGGDVSNTIAAATVQGSIIAEGTGNGISVGDYQVISGGANNNIDGPGSQYNVIGGGDLNRIGNAAGGFNHSGIGSGWDNEVYGSEAVIAGGHNNTVSSYAAGIVGGHDNTIGGASNFSFIGGGTSNNVNVDHGAIGGGSNNRVTGNNGFIGGGTNNEVTGPMGTVGGGGDNRVLAPEATIAGGHINRVESYASTIGGGHDHIIWPGSDVSFIGGGRGNQIRNAPEATIAGGHNNFVEAYVATVGGGHDNMIPPSGNAAFIGGGRMNNAGGTSSAIGGGNGNNAGGMLATIGGGEQNSAPGDYTTIPGGDNLQTNASYAQSAMGFMNDPRGAIAIRPTVTPTAAFDDPLFMVGNGDFATGTRSNAFEVSYNGHSVVYDVNGNTNGGGRIPIEGGTYTDNIVYAWGDIDASGAINADFGVSSVAAGGGVYVITIAVNDPLTNPITLNQASITATITDDNGSNGCAFITSSRIGVPGPNQFTIRTYSQDCGASDLPFMFKVTGRQ